MVLYGNSVSLGTKIRFGRKSKQETADNTIEQAIDEQETNSYDIIDPWDTLLARHGVASGSFHIPASFYACAHVKTCARGVG